LLEQVERFVFFQGKQEMPKKKIATADAAKAMSDAGASKGGVARAQSLTPERRKEIARLAVEARWKKAGKTIKAIPIATHGDKDHPLTIGEIKIPCYVLDDERRVITLKGMIATLSMKKGGGEGGEGGNRLSKFITGKSLSPFVQAGVRDSILNPIQFKIPGNPQIAHGYEATILADICESVLEARKQEKLWSNQQHVAIRCEILVRGFARLGIVALVDEATGFQYVRARDDLRKILEKYVSKELARWEKTFEQEFYEHLYRLKNWSYDPTSNKRTHACAYYTANLVYDRIHPDLLKELKSARCDGDKPNSKLFQWLTTSTDGGHPRLKQHLEGVVSLMSVAQDWEQFEYWVDRRYPRINDTMRIPFQEMDLADSTANKVIVVEKIAKTM
jgi:hypothetical protein